MKPAISIRELHAKTGEHVRACGSSSTPTPITDRGRVVAMLVSPEPGPARKRVRTLLPEYAKVMHKASASSVLEDLDAVRGER